MSATTARTTTIEERAAAALKRLEEKDPGLKQMLKKAYGYAVFPSVGKASLVVGGAYGHGAVYERGRFIGYATISQLTAGVQIGGDTFTEILVFQNKEALERLKHGKMAFAANASAVLVKAGAAAARGFSNGVAAYAYAEGGMLLEAAIGGQKFKFKPADEADEQQSKAGGRGKGATGQGKAAASGAQDEGEAEGDEGQDDEESGGLLGRAMGGVRSALGGAADGVKSAASRVTETARAHPVAATFVATTVAAGAALLIVRAVRSGGSSADEGSDDETGYDEGSEDDESRPQARAEEGEEDEQDQGDEGREAESEQGDTLNQLRDRRRRSRA